MADKIAAMADRFRTEIDTGDEETEAKKANGAGDEILEYAVQYAQDGFRAYLWSLWSHQDIQENCRAVLLEGHDY